MVLATEFTLGVVVFQNIHCRSSDLVNRQDITFNKIQSLKTAAHEFCKFLLWYKQTSLESKVKYWSFCKPWSWTVSFFSQSLHLDRFSNFLAMYPDIVVATSELSSSKTLSEISSIRSCCISQSFHNFHPR